MLCPQLVAVRQSMELIAKRHSQRDAREKLKALRKALYQAKPTWHDFLQQDQQVRPSAAGRPAHPPTAATPLLTPMQLASRPSYRPAAPSAACRTCTAVLSSFRRSE